VDSGDSGEVAVGVGVGDRMAGFEKCIQYRWDLGCWMLVQAGGWSGDIGMDKNKNKKIGISVVGTGSLTHSALSSLERVD
jgi:hypothetical protein